MRKGNKSAVAAVLLATIVCMGLLPAASVAGAAGSGRAILTYAFDAWDKFSEPNGSNVKSLYLSGGSIKYDLSNAAMAEEGGVLTKAQDDSAVCIETADGTKGSNAVQVVDLSTSTSGLNTGQQLRISWEVAKADANTEFTAWCTISGGYLFEMKTDGKVKFCGSDISGFTWEPNHWYQVDLILFIGTRDVALYLDGQYCMTKKVNAAIQSIGGLVFAAQPGSAHMPGKHWMDNVKLEAYDQSTPFRGLMWDGIQDGAGVVPGKEISVFACDGKQTAFRMELLLDGAMLAEGLDTDALSVRLPVDLPMGSHTLTARAMDVRGNVIEQTIAFTAREPQTTFAWTGVREGVTVQPGAAIAVAAQNEVYEITSTELLLDKTLLVSDAAGELSVDLPERLAYGPHTLTARATDSFGGTSEEVIAFICALTTTNLIYEADVANYAAAKPGPGSMSGMSFSFGNDAFIYSGKADGARGNCILMGADSRMTSGAPYLQRWIEGYTHDNLTLKTSIYMNDANTSTTLVFRRDEAIQPEGHPNYGQFAEDVIFYGDRLEYYEGQILKQVPIQTKIWYDVVFSVDLMHSTYSLWLTSSDDAYHQTPITLDSPFRNTIHSTRGIRLQTRVLAEEGGFVAINDYKITYEKMRPYLTAAAYEQDGQVVTGAASAAADTLVLLAAGTMDSVSVNELTLLCEGVRVPTGRAAIRNNAFAVPVEDLVAGCDYQADLLITADGEQYPVLLDFTVPGEALRLEKAAFRRTDGNIVFCATARNMNSVEKNALVIVSKYKNGVMTDIAVTESAMTDGTEISATLQYERGCEYRAVVRDGWDALVPINHKVYIYNDVQ